MIRWARNLLIGLVLLCGCSLLGSIVGPGDEPEPARLLPSAAATPPARKATAEPLSTVELPRFENCRQLRARHPRGVSRVHPAYRRALDRDRDGMACEPA